MMFSRTDLKFTMRSNTKSMRNSHKRYPRKTHPLNKKILISKRKLNR